MHRERRLERSGHLRISEHRRAHSRIEYVHPDVCRRRRQYQPLGRRHGLRRCAGIGLDFPAAPPRAARSLPLHQPARDLPATYIWKVRPRQQNGYYTAFFWGNDGPFYWGPTSPDSYYGAHPYPSPPPNGSAHKWEISVYGDDYLSSQDVVYDRWYTQALRVWSDGSGKHHEFYWDLPDTTRVIRVNVSSSYGNIMPPSPALTFGDAPWNESDEIMNGVMRGFQIYSVTLTLSDVLAEINSPRSTANGASKMWYMNLNPTPATSRTSPAMDITRRGSAGASASVERTVATGKTVNLH